MKRTSLALLAAGLLVIAACGTDGEEGTSDTTVAGTDAPTTTAAEATTTAAAEETTTSAAEEATTTAAAGAEGVHTADTDLGSILVDGDGFTLYLFTNDTEGTSNCNEGCIENWPAVPGDTAIGGDLDASIFSTVTRADGSEQLAVNGLPLYRFTPDEAPGDVNGQGVGGVWFVVGADGNMIEGPEAAFDRGDY